MTRETIVCTRSIRAKSSKSTSYKISRVLGVLTAAFFLVNVAGVGIQLFAVWLVLRPPACEAQR